MVFSECARVADRAKTWQWQLDEDVKSLLERGLLDGSCGELSLTSQLTALLRDWPVVYLDSFTTSAYPDPPKVLLSIPHRQAASLLWGQSGDGGPGLGLLPEQRLFLLGAGVRGAAGSWIYRDCSGSRR